MTKPYDTPLQKAYYSLEKAVTALGNETYRKGGARARVLQDLQNDVLVAKRILDQEESKTTNLNYTHATCVYSC